VPQAKLGVVQDGHQHVVELVGGSSDKLTERGHALRADELLLERR
jgi:hypothetical protein